MLLEFHIIKDVMEESCIGNLFNYIFISFKNNNEYHDLLIFDSLDLETMPDDHLIIGLVRFFQEKLPSAQKLEIFNVKRILGGMETEIHSFSCKYQENGKSMELKFVVRLYHSKYGFEFAESEFEVLKKLKTKNYPVPEVFFKETTPRYLGKPFIIIEFIDGILMGEKMLKSLEKGDFQTLQILVDQFSELFLKLHRIDWLILVEDKNEFLQDPKGLVMNLMNWYENKIKKYDMNSVIPVIKWLKSRMGSVNFPKENLSLVHGDFHPNNIILKGTEPYVIDWHGIRIRDYRTDLGQTSLLIEVYVGKELRNSFVDSYVKQGGNIQNLAFFEVLAALIRFYEYFEITTTSKRNEMTNERVKGFEDDIQAIRKVYEVLKERTEQDFISLKESLNIENSCHKKSN